MHGENILLTLSRTFKKFLPLYAMALFFAGCTLPGEKQTRHPHNSLARSPDTIYPAAGTLSSDTITQDSARYLFDFTGDYILDPGDVNCKMELNIYPDKKQFAYRLKTNTRQLHGDVVITPNEKQDGYYITLKGIEWSEYEGAATPEEDEIKEQDDMALPQEVQGVLYENEITIQNTGNAMNYYVKFGDCDLKYIHLVKTGKRN